MAEEQNAPANDNGNAKAKRVSVSLFSAEQARVESIKTLLGGEEVSTSDVVKRALEFYEKSLLNGGNSEEVQQPAVPEEAPQAFLSEEMKDRMQTAMLFYEDIVGRAQSGVKFYATNPKAKEGEEIIQRVPVLKMFQPEAQAE